MKNGLNPLWDSEIVYEQAKQEDGFTSHVYAMAILLSLVLVFSLATSQWIMQKSSTVQTVADTAALASSNTVGSYRKIVQIADAVIFTVGLTGILCISIGFVVACIPYINAFGVKLTEFGMHIIRARNKAVEHVYRVFEMLEKALPYLIGLSAVRIIRAQSSDNLNYHGFALGFPLTSESDFPEKDEISVPEDTNLKARQIAENTEHIELFKKQRDQALEEGWLADCGNPDRCLRERAAHLAKLSVAENPHYASPEVWSFAAPILRSRNYYAKRYAMENTSQSDIEELRQSLCRKMFYKFAKDKVDGAFYSEDDNSISVYIPHLPSTLEEYKSSDLYTGTYWYSDGKHLHMYNACPEITGSLSPAALHQIDSGELSICPHCKLSISDQALVSRLTTVNPTGYEYWYRRVEEASERYAKASQEVKRLENDRKHEESDIQDRFKEILEQFSMKRVKFIPPGSRGCVAFVYREEGAQVPQKLNSNFIDAQALPAGYAIAGSALAPDKSPEGVNVLEGFASAILPHEGVGGIAGACISVWGSLIEGYGKGLNYIDDSLDNVISRLGSGGGFIVSKFKYLLNEVLVQVGLEPVDMTTYKPALVQAIKIINAETDFDVGRIYSVFESIPTKEYELQDITLSEFGIQIDHGNLNLFDLDLPFLDNPISVTVPIGALWQGL